MDKKENHSNFLVSIIKVEPECFQTIDQDSYHSTDNVSRLRANTYSDPIVHQEQLTEATAMNILATEKQQSEYSYIETLNAFVRKGNYGLRKKDPHTCCFCQKIYSCYSHLKTHLESAHYKTRKLFCDLCPNVYFTKNSMLGHMRNTHLDKNFACNACEYKTANKMYFKKHAKVHAAKVECPTCKKQVSSLKQHMKSHKPKKSCPICQKMFGEYYLRAHMKTHRNQKIEELAIKGNVRLRKMDPHTCCLCEKVYSRYCHLKHHLETFHCKTQKMFCDLCPKFYYSKITMYFHMRDSHFEKKFACSFCEYKTTIKNRLERHKFIHSAKVECPICKIPVTALKPHMRTHAAKISCPKCKKLISRYGIKRHIKKSHSEAYKCKVCAEAFNCHKDLRRHFLRDHSASRTYECHCGSIYNAKGSLKKHCEQVHSNEGINCKICLKHYKSRLSLELHCKKYHSQTLEKLENNKMKVLNREGPFICDKCGSTLSSRTSFNVHMRYNHSIATMFCDLCPQSFFRKGLLIQHIERDHLKLRPFECQLCDYKSFGKNGLQLHMFQHSLKTECKICHKLVAKISVHLRIHLKANCPICNKMFSKDNLAIHIRRMHKSL